MIMKHDGHKKSIIKSIIWRVVGVLTLAAVTYFYTRNWVTTSWVTFLHHAVFLIVFYLHERFWQHVDIKNLKARSILKCITYETILGNFILGIITLAITGDIQQMSQITLTYIAIKHLMYICNEFVWKRKEKEARKCPTVYVYLTADIIHSGHLEHLENAKKLGYVVAGVLTKKAVMEKKPEPILSFQERIRIVRALKNVDKAIPQTTYSPLPNVKKVKPDILMETTDHKEQPANNYVKSYGGKVVITHVPDSIERRQSSTKIKNKVIQR